VKLRPVGGAYVSSCRIASRIFYPAGKAFRNILLKALGIPYIYNLRRNQ